MAIEEVEPTEDNLKKLKEALTGLDAYYLALVWDFAQYLLRLQARVEEIEKVKQN
jgi:hypothetical protein